MGLPLIPAVRVPGVYNGIAAQAPNLAEAPQMHQYVFDTYIDPNGALFPNACWCVFGMVNRTTNMCEGFHNALSEAISVKHPSIYRLIETLQDVEASNERVSAQLAMGAPPKRRKPKYTAVNEAIQRLTDQTFRNGLRLPNVQSIIQYLDAVAHQLWDVKHG